MKYKWQYFLVGTLAIFLVGGTLAIFLVGGSRASADGANFAVNPILGENQADKNVGYFDLLLKPNQSQVLKFSIVNGSDKSVKVATTFGTAFTSSSGTVAYTPDLVKPDSSLKINLKDYIKLPKTVTVKAHEKAIVTAEVTMPPTQFQGLLAGGFNFSESKDSKTAQASKGNGVTLINNYNYVIGLTIQQSLNKISPDLVLGSVAPEQVNGRNVIAAKLTNPKMTYLMDMNAQAEVINLKDKSVKYTYNNADMKMAPNSAFKLAIPVSIQGVLNGKSSTPLKAGKYQLRLSVYGEKNDKGPYKTQVAGKTSRYDYRWIFKRDFNVSAKKARNLNAKDVSISSNSQQNNDSLIVILGVSIIVLLLLIILLLLLKARREKNAK